MLLFGVIFLPPEELPFTFRIVQGYRWQLFSAFGCLKNHYFYFLAVCFGWIYSADSIFFLFSFQHFKGTPFSFYLHFFSQQELSGNYLIFFSLILRYFSLLLVSVTWFYVPLYGFVFILLEVCLSSWEVFITNSFPHICKMFGPLIYFLSHSLSLFCLSGGQLHTCYTLNVVLEFTEVFLCAWVVVHFVLFSPVKLITFIVMCLGLSMMSSAVSTLL